MTTQVITVLVPPYKHTEEESSSASSTSTPQADTFLAESIDEGEHNILDEKQLDLSKLTAATQPESDVSFGSVRTVSIMRDMEDGGVETSRITVNTHNSILNITEEDDEDDETMATPQQSFIFEEIADDAPLQPLHAAALHPTPIAPITPRFTASSVPATPPHYKEWCERSSPSGSCMTCNDTVKKSNTSGHANTQGSLLDSVTEQFMDSLCFARTVPSSAVDHGTMVMWDQYQRVLEYDISEMLGCQSPPSRDELEKLWSMSVNLAHPCRNGPFATPEDSSNLQKAVPKATRVRRVEWRERAIRVHRLRMERVRNVSPSSVLQVAAATRSRSMDDSLWSNRPHSRKDTTSLASWKLNPFYEEEEEEELGVKIGYGLEPIDMGYDSDPEESAHFQEPPITKRMDPIPALQENHSHDVSVHDSVQESLNMKWTVTWHPGKNDAFTEPKGVEIWIERGTLIENNSVMLEPNFMWREFYHPDLNSKRRLNESTQNPHNIRLLNLCRVLDTSSVTVDRTVYPLVRSAYGILLRTSDGKELMFEAQNIRERNDMIRRWKMTIARFATLAVMEDLETICQEFFSPMITSRMLVPDYDQPDRKE